MREKQFKKLGFETIQELENFLNRDDVKQMIGAEKYDHYCELWLSNYASSVMGEPKKKIEGKFNWLAFIASPLAWYGYRRMYALVTAFCAAFAVLSFTDIFFGVDTSLGMLAAFLVLIFMSKDVYLGHLVKCTKKIDSMQSQEQVECFLERRRGTSTALAVFTTLFFLAVTVYVAFVMAEELMNEMNAQMYRTGGYPYPAY